MSVCSFLVSICNLSSSIFILFHVLSVKLTLPGTFPSYIHTSFSIKPPPCIYWNSSGLGENTINYEDLLHNTSLLHRRSNIGTFSLMIQSNIAPRTIQDTMMPEAKGIKYDECEMALFRAKLSYHATIDERLASQNSNLTSIAEAQAKILKGWEIQMQKGRDLTGKDEGRSANDVRAMAQFEWRYLALENAAVKGSGKG